jgi:hypothetical protein
VFLSWMAPRGIIAAAVSSIFGDDLWTHRLSNGALARRRYTEPTRRADYRCPLVGASCSQCSSRRGLRNLVESAASSH